MATKTKLILFYIDNTLTEPRAPAQPSTVVAGQPALPVAKPEMPSVKPDVIAALAELKKTSFAIGIVSGSDLETLNRQFGGKVLEQFDYVFVDNGLTAYKGDVLLTTSTSLKAYLKPDNCTILSKKILEEIIKLPVQMTGTFLELRTDMIHITPIGRNADAEERKKFQRLDNRKAYRQKLIDALKLTLETQPFKDLNLTLALSGTISVNIVPETWDKSYCIQTHLVKESSITEIYIIGDKTRPGGEGSALPSVSGKKITGYTVIDPADTLELLQDPSEPFHPKPAGGAGGAQQGVPGPQAVSGPQAVPGPQAAAGPHGGGGKQSKHRD